VPDWIIETLAKEHKREGFSCGKQTLDDFIRARVTQYEKRRLGRTFVAVEPGSRIVMGFYTLAAGAISFAHMPVDAARKLPKHSTPVILLARLAVDQSFHGRRLGEGLLLDALQRSLDLSGELGVHAVEVVAIDDSAATFYKKYGFTPLIDNPLHLYLPMTTIEKVLG
jgi:GNAT superfamily N-acetyltransferase